MFSHTLRPATNVSVTTFLSFCIASHSHSARCACPRSSWPGVYYVLAIQLDCLQAKVLCLQLKNGKDSLIWVMQHLGILEAPAWCVWRLEKRYRRPLRKVRYIFQCCSRTLSRLYTIQNLIGIGNDPMGSSELVLLFIITFIVLWLSHKIIASSTRNVYENFIGRTRYDLACIERKSLEAFTKKLPQLWACCLI